LSVHERRPEPNGSLRVLYSARLCDCCTCPLKAQCQEALTTLKPRRVSAVFWPAPSGSRVPPPQLIDASPALFEPPPPYPALAPVLWGDWERCQLRRNFIRLLRTQTVDLTFGSVKLEELEEHKEAQHTDVQTRAQRAHYRLSWQQRMALNARRSSAFPLEVTIHGLPVAFAQSIGLDGVTAA
jgi:hypothetical protein